LPPYRTKRPTFAFLALTALAPSAAPLVAALALAPTPALAQPADSYKQHMANGIKLYQDANYPAAIVEFQAAYAANPKASPLVNIALCHKARFNYPKAIRTLETVLEKHGDTMDASDKDASHNAIREMRNLLAYITVQLSPRKATLLLDDEEQPPGTADQPIPVGPGPHKFTARADGFAQAERSVTVASGDKPEIKLSLVAEKGWVTITAPNPKMTIAIDQRPLMNGQWAGMLTPGPHLVQMYGRGFTPFNAQITVVAGKQINLRPGVNGVPGVVPTPPAPPPEKPPPPPTPPRRGFYALALGSILVQTNSPVVTPSTNKTDWGGAFGLRVGYQVNAIAGFDISFEHSSIGSSSTSMNKHRIYANRLAGGLRLISTGRTVRFVGALGGGPAINDFTFRDGMNALGKPTVLACVQEKDGSCQLKTGVDAFAYLELGLEIDIDHVLIDLGLESEFQATGNMLDGRVFDGKPLVNLGPALRVGYRFW
jgi:hypothetical protein